MTAKDCILAKAKAGQTDQGRAARLAELYDTFDADARGAMSPNSAADAAARETLIALQRQTKQRKRRLLKQMRAQDSIRARAEANPELVDVAMLSVLDFDPSGRAVGPNLSITAQRIRGRAHALMVDSFERFRSKGAGVADLVTPGRQREKRIANSRSVVRELFGEATNDPEAKRIAGGIGEALEYLRRAFNHAGGDIPKRKDFGMPQSHNRRAVAADGRDEWIEFTAALLDRERMVDLDTGLPMVETKFRRLLGETRDRIATDGLNELGPGGMARRGIIGRRQESRFLVFRDADAWLKYQARYGEADLFTAITGHIEVMSRDIATIEVLGPNPEATMRFMESLIDKSLSDKVLAKPGLAAAATAGQIGNPKTALRDTYNGLTGRTNQPANPTVANISAANRNVVISSMLGGAFFSALADTNFGRITAKFNGIPTARVLARQLKMFSPRASADQRQAVRLGFGAQGWASQAIAQERYLGEVIGPEWTKRLADTSLRLGLLSPWTQAGRWGFMSEMLGFVTDHVGRRFAALPAELQRSFGRYGITAADWDLMRKIPLWRDPETGAEFLRPQDIIGRLDDASADTALFTRHLEAANKLQDAVLTEAEFAVPSVTARSRAILVGSTQPGSLWGEITRNSVLFKGFPVTVIHTHLQRAMAQSGGTEKGKYIAGLIIGTTIMGALGQQLSEISKGRDPLAMDGPEFWLQAMQRGGGVGIFGDFLFSDVNRFGGGITQTLAGPVIGTEIPQAIKLTVGNLRELIVEGAAKNVGREVTRFAKLMTPGAKLWYARLALERLVFDEMQKMLDPDAAKSFRRVEQRLRSERGQRFFSRPGQGFPPDRAPDLTKAFGG